MTAPVVLDRTPGGDAAAVDPSPTVREHTSASVEFAQRRIDELEAAFARLEERFAAMSAGDGRQSAEQGAGEAHDVADVYMGPFEAGDAVEEESPEGSVMSHAAADVSDSSLVFDAEPVVPDQAVGGLAVPPVWSLGVFLNAVAAERQALAILVRRSGIAFDAASGMVRVGAFDALDVADRAIVARAAVAAGATLAG